MRGGLLVCCLSRLRASSSHSFSSLVQSRVWSVVACLLSSASLACCRAVVVVVVVVALPRRPIVHLLPLWLLVVVGLLLTVQAA